MPIYEYECPKCCQRFELLRRAGADDGEVVCPGCGAEGLRRVVSLFATASGTDSGCAPASSG